MHDEQGSESSAHTAALDLEEGSRAMPIAGVALYAAATERTVRVAAAVASGVAESMQLGLEAAASLNAIAVEGSRNVVAHAYPPGHTGPLWMQIEPPAENPSARQEVTISFRDAGRGCSFWPTGGDPPGIGVSLICELSERTEVTSRRGVGTVMKASVAISEDFDPSTPLPGGDGPSGDSELRFEGTELMRSVLPRALGAHIEGPGATVDQIVDASRLGAAIADDLAGREDVAPTVSISERSVVDDPLSIRVGPIAPSAAERLINGLESSWDGRPGSLTLTAESLDSDRAIACVELDVASV